MALQPDTLLHDRYRIVDELGHGGMGAVYRGRDENLGVEVAVKENLFVSPEAERQFKREATLLASLRHPNLPRVTDHFVIPGQGQYLVMDFIPGEDAKQTLEREQAPLPEGRVVAWAREILDALIYLHSRPQPVIHRDIKPGNIKITPEGRAVLVDFGLAKVHDLSAATTTGAKALTPGFAPPEQYGLGRTEPRTDLYSLAATLYTLLTNRIPADSIERAMGQRKLVPLREYNPAVSEVVATAIERSMAIKPEERFATAAEFAAALATAPTQPAPALPQEARRRALEATQANGTPSAGAGGPPPAGGVAPAAPAAKPSGLPWLALGGVLVVVGLIVVGALAGVGLLQSGWLNHPAPSATPAVLPTIPSVAASVAAEVAPTATPAPSTATWTPTVPPPSDTPAPTLPQASPTPVPPTMTSAPAATPTRAVTPLGGGVTGQIAFASDRNGGVPQIFILNVEGKTEADRQVTQLTFHPDGACEPAWSPDGQYVLFVSPCDKKRDQYPSSAIYRMKADGSDVQPFITEVGGVFDPDWSKSGIAYTFLEGPGRPRVIVTDSSGGASRNISAAQSADSHPTWSGDGARLAFVNTSATGKPVIYWMFKNGTFKSGRSLPDPVTRDAQATSPAWSPDGRLVAFVTSFQIWVVPWDKVGYGSQLLTNAGPNESPHWSPDSRHLVFESWRDNANHDIYIMNATTGGEVVRLTDNPAADFQPAWRP